MGCAPRAHGPGQRWYNLRVITFTVAVVLGTLVVFVIRTWVLALGLLVRARLASRRARREPAQPARIPHSRPAPLPRTSTTRPKPAPRGKAAPRPRVAAGCARPGSLYIHYVMYEGQRRVGYIGQTRLHNWRQRADEHLYGSAHWGEGPKAWAHLVIDTQLLWNSPLVTDADLDAQEMLMIREMLPLFNVEGNYANPDRIPPWEWVNL